MRISLLLAAAENGVIGKDNGLPWRLKGDMKFFREVTAGKPLVMGRKTWESLPKRPLPGRPNLIVTRDASYEAEGGEVFTSVEAALARGRELAKAAGVDEVVVIGGAEIYAHTLDKADRVYLTEVHAHVDGDTHFPDLDPAQWHETRRELHRAGPDDTADFSITVQDRIVPAAHKQQQSQQQQSQQQQSQQQQGEKPWETSPK